MKPIGELYSLARLTEGGVVRSSFPTHHSLTLAGCSIGEFCPVESAEIQIAENEMLLRSEFGLFARIRAENRLPRTNRKPEVIDVWLKI